ncbi:7-deoxyloganetin glucosyltransferase [Hibiscus syriacus]|uniref:7-deoxyloganetin glucosyltransferase n=1 Tax=Hibiscus syriacus TaxID=106335 RepID=A0A6A2XQY2_HIBSY|nr:7-deoxyloganetin glucosyltransferase [Hibiscus syriacus]
MGSLGFTDKPHAVCVPYPAQGHINPMLMLAKVLHSRGFYITFANTEFNHKRLLNPKDLMLLMLNHSSTSDVPPVSCIVLDGCMSFTLDAAEELGIPEVLFWTSSDCGFLSYVYYRQLKEKGYTPLKERYLDTVIDWIPAMEGIRLKDLPTFLRTTDPNFIMLDFIFRETERSRKASTIILNTFDDLEHQVLDALNSELPSVYSVGPLHLALSHHVHDNELKQIGSYLWREEPQCLQWLDKKEPNSVVYVNFGSITVMTADQLIEFAWGLANSKQPFLWVIRPDLVGGESAIVPAEFVEETKDRGLLATWCPQEQVLTHPSIGGFLTHSGWNSTIEVYPPAFP